MRPGNLDAPPFFRKTPREPLQWLTRRRSHRMARLPALFLGHGNPMNAIQPSEYTEAWARIASEIPRPKAIVSISAHWYVAGSRVSAEDRPRTIHDFGGFPRPLYQVQYPAPGSPRLAARVRDLLAPAPIELDTRWGLDHGTWSLLVHLYPGADIPVVQLGIDETLSAHEHYELARGLAPLRDEDVLGSRAFRPRARTRPAARRGRARPRVRRRRPQPPRLRLGTASAGTLRLG